jgi:hypothetical protein
MLDEEWIKKLEDSRKVKFIYQQLPKGGAFITAQVAGRIDDFRRSRESFPGRAFEEIATLNS